MKPIPKLFLNTLLPNSSDLLFFKDIDLEINAKITRTKENVIDTITFILNATGTCDTCGASGLKYKIISINPCTDSNGIIFYMIHLLENKDIPDNLTFTASRSKELKDIKIRDKRDFVLFRFNIFSEEPGGIEFPCNFNSPQPETKDGSIIIGG